MATSAETGAHGAAGVAVKRRDFLYLATGAMGAVGAALAVWPLIDSMNPAADVLALSSIEVDLSPIQLGQRITVQWRGQPVFIAHRTPEEIKEAQKVTWRSCATRSRIRRGSRSPSGWSWSASAPISAACRSAASRPTRAATGGGWFCPCHGSQYDTSGRIRQGPAPANLAMPPIRLPHRHQAFKIG